MFKTTSCKQIYPFGALDPDLKRDELKGCYKARF